MKTRLRIGAFTLIELLVVIAILTILAAILFPVFSSARDRARQATCLSNEKQIGLATLQYLQDNDGTYPICDYVVKGYTGPNNSWVTWCWEIQPYIKNWDVFQCPNFQPEIENVTGYHIGWFRGNIATSPSTFPITNWTDINGVPNGALYSWAEGFALNSAYIDPDVNCGNLNPNAWSALNSGPSGAAEPQFDSPSQTIFATDSLPLPSNDMLQGSWRNDMHYTDAPADVNAPDACYQQANTWGPNSWDTAGLANYPNYGTGNVDLRHFGGADVIFCDGHAKLLTPGALAAGTNWYPTINPNNIYITDLSQYLWSLKKSGTHDII